MRFPTSVLFAAALSTVALPTMSAPIQQVYDIYGREFGEEIMAREPFYGRIGTIVRRPIIAREDKLQPAQGPKTVPSGLASGLMYQIIGHPARSLPEDELELEARGWFSAIKDGIQGISALKSAHDSKKKKKGKRGLDSEGFYDLYERDLDEYDYY